MMRRRLLSLGLVALLVWAASLRAAGGLDRPNFVLCMTDDQGWGDVGYNGNPILRTPHLDAMAASGVRFDRFYAAHPVCSPTRGSVLSGRSPGRYRSYSWGFEGRLAHHWRAGRVGGGAAGQGRTGQGRQIAPEVNAFTRIDSSPS